MLVKKVSFPCVQHSTFRSHGLHCPLTNGLEFTGRWSAWSSCWLWTF